MNPALIRYALMDRVLVATGPTAGRTGTVTALMDARYHVHLDHPASESCEHRYYFPVELRAAAGVEGKP